MLTKREEVRQLQEAGALSGKIISRQPVLRLLVIAQESKPLAKLCAELSQNDFICSMLGHGNGLMERITAQPPDLILMETHGQRDSPKIRELVQSVKQQSLPIIALVAEEMVDSVGDNLDVDDFLVSPYDVRELALRIKRLVRKNGNANDEIIKCGGLVIDCARCEVSLEGEVITLTFKEYQLLKLLASNRGHVFTREALLDRVWGYDYYGGDRTVDVHVRRLRSKIEDSKHAFIETVRNIGYRFRRNT